MIANTTIWAEGFKIAALTTQSKGIAWFVDRRSWLMKLRMESTVSEDDWAIFPSTVPPTKIKVKK
jgi:hypothetical protein